MKSYLVIIGKLNKKIGKLMMLPPGHYMPQ